MKEYYDLIDNIYTTLIGDNSINTVTSGDIFDVDLAKQTIFPLAHLIISDIEFGQNENEIFVTFYNYGITSIWFTNDGGSSWTAIEGDLPDLPVTCILQNPLLPNELIIGTKLGVWRTSEFTATNVEWTQSFNGMSDVTVVDLDLRPSDNTILATTHGRGMFTSVFTSDVASVDEVFAENKVFSVYPTISNGDFNVVAKSELGASKMYIYDINGKLVFNSQLNFNESQTQNVSVNLKSGIYIVNIMGQNNKKSSEKIIIKKLNIFQFSSKIYQKYFNKNLTKITIFLKKRLKYF